MRKIYPLTEDSEKNLPNLNNIRIDEDEDFVGDGDNGDVYKFTYNGKEYVTKVISLKSGNEESILEEAGFCAQAGYEVAVWKDVKNSEYHIVMPYFGENLLGLKSNSESSNLLNLTILFTRIASRLWQLPFSHEDLKPDNILRLSTKVKLIDFGSSLSFSQQYASAGWDGNGYTAPEHFDPSLEESGIYSPNSKSDVFSIALIFIELTYRLLNSQEPYWPAIEYIYAQDNEVIKEGEQEWAEFISNFANCLKRLEKPNNKSAIDNLIDLIKGMLAFELNDRLDRDVVYKQLMIIRFGLELEAKKYNIPELVKFFHHNAKSNKAIKKEAFIIALCNHSAICNKIISEAKQNEEVSKLAKIFEESFLSKLDLDLQVSKDTKYQKLDILRQVILRENLGEYFSITNMGCHVDGSFFSNEGLQGLYDATTTETELKSPDFELLKLKQPPPGLMNNKYIKLFTELYNIQCCKKIAGMSDFKLMPQLLTAQSASLLNCLLSKESSEVQNCNSLFFTSAQEKKRPLDVEGATCTSSKFQRV